MASKELTGKVAADCIRRRELPALPPGVIEAFLALGDATSAVSDALDEIGIPATIAGSRLRGTIPGARMVGRALTLRNMVQSGDPMEHARRRINKMGEIEGHNLAEPGDVLVIEGVPGVSNMGGIGALIGKRQGEAGAVVDGGVRDVGQSRAAGYPIWSAEVTPISGKWRLETVEINGPVVICGVRVYPGDLVVADDAGVCFIPAERVTEVLAYATRKAKSETDKEAEISRGLTVAQLAGAKG